MSKHTKGRKGAQPQSPTGIALAAGWPVYETLLSEHWDAQGSFAAVLIARRSTKTGRIGAASFLVDLACLGVKQTQVQVFKDPQEYTAGLRAHVTGVQRMLPADFNLAAKIILTGVAYAERLGFRPDPVYAQARALLSGADPDACSTPVPTGGPEGKPLFVSGPYDDVQKVMNQLTRAVGAGNFHFMIQDDGSYIEDTAL